MGGQHWTRAQMLRHPLFWCVLPSILGPSAFVTALFFQQVHLAEVKGWSHVSLVALFPLYTVVSTLFMLLAGWALDRFGTARLMPFYQLPIAASFLVMAGADSLWLAALAFVLMGMTTGANSTLPSAFWAEFYGTRHIGGIKSIATAAMVLGSAIGPAISGVLIDRGIVFPDQMIGIAIWFVVASGLIWFGVSTAARSLTRPA
jgi:MFS family permease